MKVLVTGAGGFVGEHLIRFLLHRKHDVVAIGINNGTFLKAMRIKTHIVNILDIDVLNEVMKEENPEVAEKAETKVRKAVPISAGNITPTRKAEPVSKYKVVSK